MVEAAQERHRELEQKSIAELARRAGKDPLDFMLDLALDEDLATIFTAQLLKACKQTEIIAREGNYIARLDIQPDENGDGIAQLDISANSEQTGSSEVIVDASVEGVPLLISFNIRYLREALEVIKTPTVILETNAPNTPGLLRPVDDESFKHIIMPMNIPR